MKNLQFTIVILLLMFCNISCSSAQDDQEQVINILDNFYTYYVTEIANSNSIRILDTKLDSLQAKYCTNRFMDKLPDLMEQLGGFVFIKAQDSHMSILETLSIQKDTLRINGYNVSFTYSNNYFNETTVINLNVIKENGEYKIDDLW